MDYANNRTSDLVNSQLPFFVREGNPGFSAFLEAYYEFLEQEDEVIGITNDLLDYRDIDRTTAAFTKRLYNQFIAALPQDTQADRSFILKHVKDFYRSRGTEKSVAFLMRIISGQESTVYLPKTDVLRASDGKWYIQKSLRVSNTFINGISNTSVSGLSKFVSRRVVGATSNASATIESVDSFYEQGISINELIISNPVGSFQSGETVSTIFVDSDGTPITANTTIASGRIFNLNINNAGSRYSVGQPLTFTSPHGSGAVASISSVTTGNITSIGLSYSGAGYLANDSLVFSGGGGSGANAYVLNVDFSGGIHPNTYIFYTTKISDIGNNVIMSNYSNLSNAIISSPNANSRMSDTMQTFTYGPCGPITVVRVASPGNNYISIPSITVASNSLVRSAGVLGRMDIVSPGLYYSAGDPIVISGGTGVGAAGNVATVNANGAITSVQFVYVPGFYLGGIGYSQDSLPSASVTSANGSGAVIQVTSILGGGAVLFANTGTIGSITGLTLVSGGLGYTDPPTITIAGGDGQANVTANILSGLYSYPGRYVGEDGQLSASKFLEDQDYYQNFSYVVQVQDSLNHYRNALISLVHPAGMKLFAKYEYETTL